MDNDSILRMAVDLAGKTTLHNKIVDSDKVSELIKDYFILLKKLAENDIT